MKQRVLQQLRVFMIGAAALAVAATAISQQPKAEEHQRAKGQAYIGQFKSFYGAVKADSLRAYLGQSLIVKDSAGRSFPVSKFDLGYKELGLFEDSTGKPLILAELYTQPYSGDHLDSLWLKNLDERLGYGDTLFLDNIYYKDAKGVRQVSKPVKLWISK